MKSKIQPPGRDKQAQNIIKRKDEDMQAYVRKLGIRYRLFLGVPENHKDNNFILDEFLTRRQAMRYARAKGYDIVIRNRDSINEENEQMNDYLDIRLSDREAYENGNEDGVWLSLPADADELRDSLEQIGTAGGIHGIDYFITDFRSSMPVISNLTIEHIRRMSIDELNFIAGQLEKTDPAIVKMLNSNLEELSGDSAINRVAEITQNGSFYKHLPGVRTYSQLGKHYLDTGRVQMPEEWKEAVNVSKLGQIAAADEKGVFTHNGYVCESGEAWKLLTEIPEDYRIEDKPRTHITNDMGMDQLSFDSVEKAKTLKTARTRSSASRAAARAEARGSPIQISAIDPKESVREITEKMEPEIKDIYNGELYKSFLDTLAKFHNYSFRNNVLISMQKSDATYLAGAKAWETNFNRRVRSDELGNGIKILAPDVKKERKEVDKFDECGNPLFDRNGKRITEWVNVTIPEFKVVTIYDISQTEGELLQKFEMLEGTVENYGELFSALEKTSPASVKFVDGVIGGNGYFNHINKQIIINGGMSEQQNLKTLIHEIAHARLHDNDANTDEKTREITAESIAYTVCKHYGIDTSQYSFNYIAVWSGDKQLSDLKASLGIIRKESNAIISEVNDHIKELQMPEKEKIIQEIIANIVKDDPEHPVKSLKYIENNMRKKSLTELKDIDYPFYFPEKTVAHPATNKSNAKTIKKTTPKKPSIRSELAAAKKQAATRQNRDKKHELTEQL